MSQTVDPRDLELNVVSPLLGSSNISLINEQKKEASEEPAPGSTTPKVKASATPKKRKSAKKGDNGIDEEDGTPTKKQKHAVGLSGRCQAI